MWFFIHFPSDIFYFHRHRIPSYNKTTAHLKSHTQSESCMCWEIKAVGGGTTDRQREGGTEEVVRMLYSCWSTLLLIHHSQPKSLQHCMCLSLVFPTLALTSFFTASCLSRWVRISSSYSLSALWLRRAGRRLSLLNPWHLSCADVTVWAIRLEGRRADDGITKGNQLHFLPVTEK